MLEQVDRLAEFTSPPIVTQQLRPQDLLTGSMLWNGVSNHLHNIIPEMDGKSSAVFCPEVLRMAPTPKFVVQPWT